MHEKEKATEIRRSQVALSSDEQCNNNRFRSFIKTIIVWLAQRELLSPDLAYWLINTFGLRNA